MAPFPFSRNCSNLELTINLEQSSNVSTQSFFINQLAETEFNYIQENHLQKNPTSILGKLLSKVIVPSQLISKKTIAHYEQAFLNKIRIKRMIYIPLNLNVNGKKVDVCIATTTDTLLSSPFTWVLYTPPNGCPYQWIAQSCLKSIKKISANYIFFNYPGVGYSQGASTPSSMVAIHQALLTILESKFQARKIILWGSSIGGGVQAESLKNHKFNQDIYYLSVDEFSFDQLTECAPPQFKRLVKRQGWEFNTLANSLNLPIDELIIQKSNNSFPTSPTDILSDGIIHKNHALAKRILELNPENLVSKPFFNLKQSQRSSPIKICLGVSQNHCEPYSFSDQSRILDAIGQLLI